MIRLEKVNCQDLVQYFHALVSKQWKGGFMFSAISGTWCRLYFMVYFVDQNIVFILID